MKHRFQNAEIEFVSEFYADNELYQAVCSIGAQLEAELVEFGMCPEEGFAETMELLATIADKGQTCWTVCPVFGSANTTDSDA